MDVFLVIFNHNDDKDITYSIEGCFESKNDASKLAAQLCCKYILSELSGPISWNKTRFNNYLKNLEFRGSEKPCFNDEHELNQIAKNFIIKSENINDDEWIEFFHDISQFIDIVSEIISYINITHWNLCIEIVQLQMNSTTKQYHYVFQ